MWTEFQCWAAISSYKNDFNLRRQENNTIPPYFWARKQKFILDNCGDIQTKR